MTIYSFSPFGYEGALVTVEVDLRRGIPAVDIVGLADGAVKESRERMQSAIRNSGFSFPPERILISLSPADLKKEGAGFDLPIALAVLKAADSAEGNLNRNFISENILVMGELELSGKIRPVKGIHAAVSTAAACGINMCIVPLLNEGEAMEVQGVKVFGADSLENAFNALKNPSFYKSKIRENDEDRIPKDCIDVNGVLFPKNTGFDFSEVKGQEKLIRAMEISAAGGHNLMAVGSPGCGKTMSLTNFPAINPILTIQEAHSVTRIWSLAGLIKPNETLIRIPPFRMPHQTASIEGICGGGVNCRPGEISLAHNGILFLDEASEFKSSVLQMLRVPLESGNITISRAGRSTTYPASFQLLMAVNPCPCGNFGSKSKICLCSAKSLDLYWKKFSAPLLDRIDLRVFVENPNESDSIEERKSLRSTNEIQEGIANAIKLQRLRQGMKNAKLSPSEIQEFCNLSKEVKEKLENAANRYGFSPRAMASLTKVSRTIADIAGSVNIRAEDMEEAISYRKICNDIIPENQDLEI